MVRARDVIAMLEDLRVFCLFVGYPGSGHSVVGSQIDAHRHAVVSHELHAARLVCEEGLSRTQVFTRILSCSHRQAPGRSSANHQDRSSDHRHHYPGLSQGRAERLVVIGDKRGGGTSRLVLRHGAGRVLDTVRGCVRLPLRVIHVVRNPYDTVLSWRYRQVDDGLRELSELSAGVEAVLAELDPDEVLHLRHEEICADPRAYLHRLCGFLEIEADEPYVDACSAAIFPEPTSPRLRHDFGADDIARTEDLIARHPWFAPYAASWAS